MKYWSLSSGEPEGKNDSVIFTLFSIYELVILVKTNINQIGLKDLCDKVSDLYAKL